MATIKVKFRPSSVQNNEGTIIFQLIHNRVSRQIKSGYRIYENEWNSSLSEIIIPCTNSARRDYLLEVKECIENDINRFKGIVLSFGLYNKRYTTDDIKSYFISEDKHATLFIFMKEIIDNLKKSGMIRTSETYTAALNSFCNFRENRDIALDSITKEIIRGYEAYLKRRGVSLNTSSFYMRNLRAVYNRAVEKELTPQRYPFKHTYTGVEKTVKRAVPISVIKRIRQMDLSLTPALDFARDMFLFSFYTRGMSLVDMAYLKKKDLEKGVLTYRRRKTGQKLFIKWEAPMQEIIDKYDTSDTAYLLPIIKHPDIDERTQYIYAGHNINYNLKTIGRNLGLSVSLTTYVARHAWASIAKDKNIPISVISEGMGHESEYTTRIYLASLDTAKIDKANSLILKSL